MHSGDLSLFLNVKISIKCKWIKWFRMGTCITFEGSFIENKNYIVAGSFRNSMCMLNCEVMNNPLIYTDTQWRGVGVFRTVWTSSGEWRRGRALSPVAQMVETALGRSGKKKSAIFSVLVLTVTFLKFLYYYCGFTIVIFLLLFFYVFFLLAYIESLYRRCT